MDVYLIRTCGRESGDTKWIALIRILLLCSLSLSLPHPLFFLFPKYIWTLIMDQRLLAKHHCALSIFFPFLFAISFSLRVCHAHFIWSSENRKTRLILHCPSVRMGVTLCVGLYLVSFYAMYEHVFKFLSSAPLSNYMGYTDRRSATFCHSKQSITERSSVFPVSLLKKAPCKINVFEENIICSCCTS